MTDLWTEATYDAEADAMARKVTAARVSAVDLWPFLAGAENETDFANRKAIVADRLDQIVAAMHPNDPVGFGVVRSSLEASLDEDYRVIAEARAEEERTRQRVAFQVQEQQARARVEAALQREAAQECEYCGQKGHDYTVHPEAVADANAWGRQRANEEEPFGRHVESASDTGTCAECGRGISYDRDSRKWSHDNEGPDTAHPAKKATRTAGVSDLDDAGLDKELRRVMEQQNNTRDKGMQESLRNFRRQLEDEQKKRKGGGESGGSGGGQGRDEDGKFAARTATRYCPTHKVYVGEGNQENHDHCPVETRKKKDAAKTAGLQVKKFQGGPGNMWGLWDTEADTWHEGDYDDAQYAAGVPYWGSEDAAKKHTGSKTAAEVPPAPDATQPAAEQTSAQVVERRVDQDPETGEFVGSEWVEKEGDPNTLVQSDSTFGKNPRFKSQEEGDAWVAEAGGEEAPEEEPAEVEDTTKTDPATTKVPEQFQKKTQSAKTAVKVGDRVSDDSGRKGVVEDFTDDKVQVHWDNTNGSEWVSPDSLSKESAKTAADYSTDKAPGRWVAEVAGVGENVWSRNSLTFDTREEAERYAIDLGGRWMGMDLARVRQIPEGGLPPGNTESVDLADPDIVVNWRGTTAAKTADRSPEEVAALRAEQQRLKAEWDEAFAALRAAGLEADADDPIAKRYRDASDAVNHVNRKLDYHVIKGSAKTAETHAPYKIEERDGKFVVVNDIGETKGTHDTKEEAREQQKALYANVEGASEQAERKHESSRGRHPFAERTAAWPPPGMPYGDDNVQWAANQPTFQDQEMTLPDGRTGIISQNSDGTYRWGIRGNGVLDDADGWPGAWNVDGTRQVGYQTPEAAIEAMLAAAPDTAPGGKYAALVARSLDSDQVTSPGQVKVGDKVWFSRGHMRSAVDGTVANVTDDAVEVVGSQSRGRIRMTFADLADGEWKLHRRTAANPNPYSPSGNPYVAPMQTPGTPDDVLDGPADPNPPVQQMPMTTRPRQLPGDSPENHTAEPGIEKNPGYTPPATGRTV